MFCLHQNSPVRIGLSCPAREGTIHLKRRILAGVGPRSNFSNLDLQPDTIHFAHLTNSPTHQQQWQTEAEQQALAALAVEDLARVETAVVIVAVAETVVAVVDVVVAAERRATRRSGLLSPSSAVS